MDGHGPPFVEDLLLVNTKSQIGCILPCVDALADGSCVRVLRSLHCEDSSTQRGDVCAQFLFGCKCD
jgi:hypothetical protein